MNDKFSDVETMTHDELLEFNRALSSGSIIFLIFWWLCFISATLLVILNIDILAFIFIGCTLFILNCLNEVKKVKIRVNERLENSN